MILGSRDLSQRSRVAEKGGVPAPAVDAGHAHAALGEIVGPLAADAAAGMNVVVVAVALARPRVHQHDVHGLELVADALQLGFDVGGRGDVAIVKMAEVELDPRPEVPVQRHLVDGRHPVALRIARVVVVGRVHVGAIVGGELDELDRPALAARQLLLLEAGEQLAHQAPRSPCPSRSGSRAA